MNVFTSQSAEFPPAAWPGKLWGDGLRTVEPRALSSCPVLVTNLLRKFGQSTLCLGHWFPPGEKINQNIRL